LSAEAQLPLLRTQTHRPTHFPPVPAYAKIFPVNKLMPTPSKKPKTLQKLLFALVILLIFLSIGLAAFHKTPWSVPLEDKLRKNPLAVSDANLNAAKPVYNEYCANCHGDSGKGDGSDAMMYDPGPSDLTDSSHINKLSDGEIFYQITQGRKPMPSFRNKLSEEQRWQLVIFVRALSGAVSFPAAPVKAPDPGAPKKPDSSAKH
jgi:mono/diheme cytochrome c family protein